MPGKVNPLTPEMMIQVAFRVIGNEATITRAAEEELDFDVRQSIIRLMRRVIPLFVCGTLY